MHEINPDDIFYFLEPVEFSNARTGFHIAYDVGDTLVTIKPTEQSPHGYDSKANWVCQTKHGISVWTSVQFMVYAGILQKKT